MKEIFYHFPLAYFLYLVVFVYLIHDIIIAALFSKEGIPHFNILAKSRFLLYSLGIFSRIKAHFITALLFNVPSQLMSFWLMSSITNRPNSLSMTISTPGETIWIYTIIGSSLLYVVFNTYRIASQGQFSIKTLFYNFHLNIIKGAPPIILKSASILKKDPDGSFTYKSIEQFEHEYKVRLFDYASSKAAFFATIIGGAYLFINCIRFI